MKEITNNIITPSSGSSGKYTLLEYHQYPTYKYLHLNDASEPQSALLSLVLPYFHQVLQGYTLPEYLQLILHVFVNIYIVMMLWNDNQCCCCCCSCFSPFLQIFTFHYGIHHIFTGFSWNTSNFKFIIYK